MQDINEALDFAELIASLNEDADVPEDEPAVQDICFSRWYSRRRGDVSPRPRAIEETPVGPEVQLVKLMQGRRIILARKLRCKFACLPPGTIVSTIEKAKAMVAKGETTRSSWPTP